jgi:hypothetical protein
VSFFADTWNVAPEADRIGDRGSIVKNYGQCRSQHLLAVM